MSAQRTMHGKGHASPARVLALRATGEVRRRSAYARQVFDSLAGEATLSEEDRAFAALLTYGVVACSGTLDEAIDNRLSAKASLAPEARDCLRISAYEILYLRKSPYAAVDQGVELMKSVQPRAAGLANAVLRGICSEAGTFPWGDPDTDNAALARMHGYPEWMVSLVGSQRGHEALLQMLDATDARSVPVFIGCNPFMGDEAAVIATLANEGASAFRCGVDGCILAGIGRNVVESAVLRDGRGVVCDAAAQAVARIATPAGQGSYLEVGSGRGTKTVLLQGNAMRVHGTPGNLYALDIHEFKSQICSKRMDALRVPGVHAITGDAFDLDAAEGLPGSFTGALIDAPCTGLGTLRRHPEQRWRVKPDDIGELADGGYRMLVEASKHIEPGGFVVYSTCTVTREEDEDVIGRFLSSEQGAQFRIDPVATGLPPDLAASVTPEGYFRSMPQIGGPDGHFAARLVREGPVA